MRHESLVSASLPGQAVLEDLVEGAVLGESTRVQEYAQLHSHVLRGTVKLSDVILSSFFFLRLNF